MYFGTDFFRETSTCRFAKGTYQRPCRLNCSLVLYKTHYNEDFSLLRELKSVGKLMCLAVDDVFEHLLCASNLFKSSVSLVGKVLPLCKY